MLAFTVERMPGTVSQQLTDAIEAAAALGIE